MNDKIVAKELVRISKQISAATEIKYDELPDDRKKLIKKIGAEAKVEEAWDGIAGYIVHIHNVRLDANQVKMLVSDKNFRWIEGIDRGLAIGF